VSSAADKVVSRPVILTDGLGRSRDLAEALGSGGPVPMLLLPNPPPPGCKPSIVLCDIDLRSARSVRHLSNELGRMPYHGAKRLFVIDAARSADAFQAVQLGAHDVIGRPFTADGLLRRVRAVHAAAFNESIAREEKELASGLAAAQTVLTRIFEGLPNGQALTLENVSEGEAQVVSALTAGGLDRWLEVVWRHHSESYRHCFSVTGLMVAFAQHLGMREADQRRLARAALVHDVGKAFIPLSILDKPAKLTDAEWTIMRRHPRLGHGVLSREGSFPAETLDAVLSHHEMLDGSGYPSGLAGSEISDLVRMLTIADIFSALIEERPYKAAFSRSAAYEVLSGMRGKLDPDLVREFRSIAITH
jgi:HD-GYP domain-containing protein (c-di-GMP phosphodiesterase class II)